MTSSLSPERHQELAQLRWRAYGPDADIHADDAALARLDELERLARGGAEAEVMRDAAPPAVGEVAQPATAAVPSEAVGPGPAPEPGSAVAPGPAVAEHASPTETALEPAPTEPQGTRARLAALWRRVPRWSIAVAAAVVGVGIGLGVPALLAPSPDARLTIVDWSLDEDEANPMFASLSVEREGVRVHQSFGDLTVLSKDGDANGRCLFILVDQGWLGATCMPSPLDPVVDVQAGWGLEQVLDLPGVTERTGVRFQLHGDVVDVWLVDQPAQSAVPYTDGGG